jgi:hypothetical protein
MVAGICEDWIFCDIVTCVAHYTMETDGIHRGINLSGTLSFEVGKVKLYVDKEVVEREREDDDFAGA